MKTLARFALIAALMTALVSIITCSNKEADKSQADQDIKKAGLADPTDSLILEMTGIDSMTVFDILKREHNVKNMTSLKGSYIIQIDGIPNQGGYYWVYSVNGVMGDVACDKYVTKTGDTILWHYRQTGQLQL